MFCGTKQLKIASFTMDFICCVLGALAIVAGSYTLAYFDYSDSIRIPCTLSIVLGALLVLGTLLGGYAALRENIRLTWLFAFILLLLLFAQITVAFLQPVHFKRLANETIDTAWQLQFHEEDAMARYEMKYECCGKTGPNNYPYSGLTVPASCYKDQTINTTNLYTIGCANRLSAIFEEGTGFERISDWTLLGVEGLTVIVAGMLAISLRNSQRRNLYK